MEDAFRLAKWFPGLGDPMDWHVERWEAGLKAINDISADESGDMSAQMRRKAERFEREIESRAGRAK
jgi:hypothetical protein